MSTPTPAPRPAGASSVRVPQQARPSRWSHRFTAAAVTMPLGGLLAASPAYAAAPQPVSEQPPNTGGLLTILDWGFWLVSLAGVGGILIVAIMMMAKHRRGEAGESVGSLGWVLGGCVLAAAAGSIAGVLI